MRQPCLHRQSSNDCIVKAKASREPRDVALIRVIISEAKRRHLNRPAFRERRTWQQAEEFGKPSLVNLGQVSEVLREGMHDVLASVKACSLARASVHEMQKLVEERKGGDSSKALWQRARRQISAVNDFSKVLKDAKAAESDWRGLASTIQLRRAFNDLGENETVGPEV